MGSFAGTSKLLFCPQILFSFLRSTVLSPFDHAVLCLCFLPSGKLRAGGTGQLPTIPPARQMSHLAIATRRHAIPAMTPHDMCSVAPGSAAVL
jgi:hypothetical protein